MKAILLSAKSSSELIRLLREHFINESTSVFMANLANSSRVDIIQSTELQAQLQFQICKILLHNVYQYIEQNRMSDFIRNTMHNQIGMALYINPVYATEILKPHYEMYVAEDDYQEVENDLIDIYRSYINLMYMRDYDRFNRVLHDIMMTFVETIPRNVQVLRFELTPQLAPMVCYTDFPDQWSVQQNHGMMQPLYA